MPTAKIVNDAGNILITFDYDQYQLLDKDGKIYLKGVTIVGNDLAGMLPYLENNRIILDDGSGVSRPILVLENLIPISFGNIIPSTVTVDIIIARNRPISRYRVEFKSKTGERHRVELNADSPEEAISLVTISTHECQDFSARIVGPEKKLSDLDTSSKVVVICPKCGSPDVTAEAP